jgi:hypothetical protein
MTARDVLAPRAPYSAKRRTLAREILAAVVFAAQGGELPSARRLLAAARDYIDLACMPHKPFERAIAEAERAIELAAARSAER